ncbi:sodium/calcium exchanger protein [Rhizoctonia solani AG-3 Rhs1AP]|uniref:Sodium/calcium exchanger protein n=1 Tax=Rhizoctonia solani AG-3 Rhs1AP TaxID=1086054 RepID=X8JM04_9AGAM|nr:sodium/calcium exchanger protein [Rhizoctonia solani AG-3 Rhs1AP]
MRERPVAVQLRSAVHVTTFLHTPTITPMVILPVFALIAQAFLWANSRYADVKGVHSLATVSTLSNALVLAETCEPLRFPPVDQCAHVREDCDPPETFLSIFYLETYFCSPPRDRPLAFGGLVLWLFFLFSFIGICASDFFCPNLATIASTLGLNENVAGVTFLAFGNGSPDLFATFSAMRAGSGSLAIGELLGAASFIVSVVAGSMPLVRPFRVNPGSFIRDVGFFTMSVACILGILIDGEIHAWEALAMVGLYLIYVCVVVGGSWLEARRERLANHEALIRGEYADAPTDPTDPTFEPYHDDDYPSLPTPSVRTRAHSDPMAPSGPDTLNVPSHTRARPSLHIPHDSESRASSASASPLATSRPSSHIHQLPSFSLLGALEFRTVVNSLHGSSTAGTLSMFDAPVSPYAAGHYHRRLSIVSSGSAASSVRRGAVTAPPAMDQADLEEQRDPWDAAFSLQLSERGGANNGAALAPAAEIHRTKSPVPSIHVFSPSTLSNGAGPAGPRKLFVPEDAQVQPQWKLVLCQVMHTLFPSLVDLPSRPWLWKIVAVCSAPAIFALTLTLPVVVNDPKSESSPGEGPVTPLLVDYDESDAEDEIIQAHMEAEEHVHDVHFNKWLTAVQCALSPVFCVSVLFSGQKHVASYILAASLCGVSVSTLTAVFANDGKNPAARLARCFIGFGVAMVWIMAIADEVVQVLQTFGHIFGLSDAIIGLTIFAIGNSLADFVANFTVAAFAPVMGISACFGGPMLNMLLGIGLSGSYVISQTGESYKVNLSPTLLVSAIGLLCLLASTLIIVPLSDFNLTRRWGLMLITGYVIVMCVNVIVEVKKA